MPGTFTGIQMHFQTQKGGIQSAGSKIAQTQSSGKELIIRNAGFGHLEVEGGCALEVILLCSVSTQVCWSRIWKDNISQ